MSFRALAALCLGVLLSAGRLAPVGGSRLHLHTPKIRTVVGKALILTSDEKGERSKRYLELSTSFGEKVLVLESKETDFSNIRSGQNVNVQGVWLSRGAGGVRAVSGYTHAESTFCFVGTGIKAVPGTGPKAAAPVVTEQQEEIEIDHISAASIGPGAVAGAAAAAAAGTPYTAKVVAKMMSNTPVVAQVNTVIIPIAGVEPTTKQACAGTTMPLVNVEAVRRAVFSELNAKGITVGSTINRCSFGKSVLNTSNSVVTDMVELPCSGTTNGVSWTFSKCDFDDFNGWADAADEYLRTVKNFPLDRYKYRVYLLPPSACGFVGLGYVGCDGSYDCRVWMGGDFWNTTQAIVHEIGHNLFLGHAGRSNVQGVFDEYGDMSCTMGYCCADRCPNTPHAYQLGWIKVQQFDATNLKPGQTATVVLPSQAFSDKGGVRINASWVPALPQIYIGFRTKAVMDAALGADMANRVHVYTSGAKDAFDPQITAYKAGLSRGQVWAEPKAGLVVRYKTTLAAGAQITICRKGGPRETAVSCKAKIDWNCNGLAGRSTDLTVPKGTADPACMAFRIRRAG